MQKKREKEITRKDTMLNEERDRERRGKIIDFKSPSTKESKKTRIGF